MNMKKLLESMDTIEGSAMSMVPPMAPQPQEDKGNPVTMNVSMNASGKDNVADLIDMMKNAGLNDAGEVGADMMPPRQDIERLRDIVDGPKDMDDLKPGVQDEPCDDCGKQHVGASSCNDDIEMEDELVADEAYANEPEEEYKSIDDIIDSGNDLHKSKKGYAATAGGDNPMAVEDDEEALEDSIREELYKAIQAKMAEGRGRGKKKAKEDIKTTEGRGRGKGKKAKEDAEAGADMEACPDCGKKKQKLMACGSCGCS